MRIRLCSGAGTGFVRRDTLLRLAWYAQTRLDEVSQILVDDAAAWRNALGLPPPAWASTKAVSACSRLSRNIIQQDDHGEASHTLVWRGGTIIDRQAGEMVWQVDEFGDPHGAIGWVRFGGLVAQTPRQTADYRTLALAHGDCDRIGLVGPGPSLAQHVPDASRPEIAIISALANASYREKATADIAVTADSLALVGPSRAAAQLRENLRPLMERGGYLCAEEKTARLLASLWPELAGQIVSVPLSPETPPGTPLHASNGLGRDTGNVLTALALPLASALAPKIEIIGCDGPTDGARAWRHVANATANRAIGDLRRAHPRSQLPRDYYQRHLGEVARSLEALRNRNIEVHFEHGSAYEGLTVADCEPPAHQVPAYFTWAARVDAAPRRFMVAVAAGLTLALAILATFVDKALMIGWVALFLSSVVLLFGVYAVIHLRRRQNRLKAELSHDLHARLSELSEAILVRLEAVESRHEDDDSPPDP